MSSQDFLRRMPKAGLGFRRRDRFAQRFHIDYLLLFLLTGICCFGMVVLYSASSSSMQTMQKQGTFFLIAYCAMFVIAQVPVDFMRRAAPWLYAVGLVLLVLVLVVGIGAKGAQRWLGIGSFRFQPSEIMKVAMPLMIAAFLSRQVLPPRFLHILLTLGLIAVPTALVIKQPDLGTAILILVSGVVVLFYAGLQWWYIAVAAIGFGASLWPVWHYMLHDYQQKRVLMLFNPESDPLGAGWNIIQSKTAIGSGGLDGKGWLEGTQSRLDFLPEGHTDFIIAVMSEEFGLLGVLLLLTAYVLVIARAMVIAINAQDTFGRLVAASIATTFFVYVFVNMGMVAGMLPVVGVPLPFISQGGTAIVVLMSGFGILMAIATEQKRVMSPQ
ncbi:MAG TPA: rod shape-determining protein RodA [Cellvibrio sp.]|nr:rod shape-determining protein RodA [Cellvibrio sp.]